MKPAPRHSRTTAILLLVMACSGLALLDGCAWQVGGNPKQVTMAPTLGQQLIDLQRAKDSGAITDSEYQAQRAKLLGTP